MKRWQLVVGMCLIALLLGSSAQAGRPDKEWKTWFGRFAGGYSLVSGDASDVVDHGWNLSGGATYWPDHSPVGLDLDLGYNAFDIMSDVFEDSDRNTSGDISLWSITADALWSPRTNGVVGFNLLGGLGGYRITADIKEPGLVSGVVCPPWSWGWCYPATGVGNVIVDSESTTEFGWNAGAAITFELQSGSQLYLEMKYHWINTDGEKTEYVPILFGFRW